MEKVTVRIKKWGNSLGIVLPMNVVKSKNLKEGSELEVLINLKNKTRVGDVFGLLKNKWKKDTRRIMEEVDKEFWGIKK